MKIAAVVAEFNPFHKGHEYLINEMRSAGAEYTVAVMSGNFVQRGEPAIYDKFLRARAAVQNGADLVVELPLPWALSGAQKFARGAVSLAAACGADTLFFGSECGTTQPLELLANIVYSPEFSAELTALLAQKINFASARQMAAEKLSSPETAALLAQPNNILAVEYMAAARMLNTGLAFRTVKRLGDGYNENIYSGSGFAGAKALRVQIRAGEFNKKLVPENAAALYDSDFSDFGRLETSLLYALRQRTPAQIKSAPDISEGLENRLYDAVRKAKTADELFELLATKRYTSARLRRIVLSLFLGVSADASEQLPPYIRLLAVGEKGRELLACAKPKLPVVARAAQFKQLEGRAKQLFELECRADDTYALSFSPPRACGEYFTKL